ncbi:MAG: helix-turn-helix transcriptional regulator [Lentisphaeria bacterium]|nr:helix-turn-helix transcriptional regulator [Lentisphaeria bacterium]
MKELNYSIYLRDTPRVLNGNFQLCRLLDLQSSGGEWRGVRPDEFEITIRLESTDLTAEDVQDGIRTSMPFPHVYIKKPGSHYNSGFFAPRKAFVLIYRGEDAHKFYKLGLNSSHLAWQIVVTDEIKNLMKRIKETLEVLHLHGAMDKLDALAEQLFRELIIQGMANSGIDVEECRIRQAASWLTGHYLEEIDLDMFFKKSGFSRRSFYRHWEKIFHESPKTFLRKLRLQEAERLLGYHSYSIADIALRLRFKDVSHFIRIFRERTGMTPLQYRRRIFSAGSRTV